jgi:hypothetical protein
MIAHSARYAPLDGRGDGLQNQSGGERALDPAVARVGANGKPLIPGLPVLGILWADGGPGLPLVGKP